MSDFDTLVEQVDGQEPFRLSVDLLTNSDAHRRLSQLEERLEKAIVRPADDDVTTEGPETLAAEIATLLDEYHPTRFVFEAVSGCRWDELVADHPPDGRADVAPSFWPALLAECCTEPAGSTVDGFTRLVGDGQTDGKLNSGQRQTLIDSVREVNRGLTNLRPSFAATTLIRGTRRSSTTPPLEGSPEAGSSDG